MAHLPCHQSVPYSAMENLYALQMSFVKLPTALFSVTILFTSPGASTANAPTNSMVPPTIKAHTQHIGCVSTLCNAHLSPYGNTPRTYSTHCSPSHHSPSALHAMIPGRGLTMVLAHRTHYPPHAHELTDGTIDNRMTHWPHLFTHIHSHSLTCHGTATHIATAH